MSIKLMQVVSDGGGYPNSSYKSVLKELCNHANDDGYGVWPSQPYLAFSVGCDRRTIQRALKWLQDNEFIFCTREYTPTFPNVWRINVERLIQQVRSNPRPAPERPTLSEQMGNLDPEMGGQDVHTPQAGGHGDAPGVTPSRPGLDTMSTKPSLNHQGNTNPPLGGEGSPALEEEGDKPLAGQLKPIHIEVPQFSSKKLRDEYTEKCPYCGTQVITQEMDACVSCSAQVIWTGSKLADKRAARDKANAIDLHAKAMRAAGRQDLPAGAQKLLLKAIAVDVGGQAFYKETEAKRVQAFWDAYGEAELDKLIDAVLGRNKTLGGRALIVGVLNKMAYHGVGNRNDSNDRPSNVEMV